MLVCVECGSLQFDDVGRYCPACGADDSFEQEDYQHPEYPEFDDDEF